MATDDAGLIPVSQLLDRYNIKRSAFYNRLAALDVPPTKVGRRAFLTPVEVVRMDALADHLETGGTIHDFEDQTDVIDGPAGSLALQAESASSDANFVAFMDAIATRPEPIQALTNRLDLLEKAATHEWLLPTSDLSMTLGLSRRSVGKYPKFERYGFVFIKVGQMGAETSWRVQKAAKPKKKFKR